MRKTIIVFTTLILAFAFSSRMDGVPKSERAPGEPAKGDKKRTVQVLLSSDTDIYARGLNGIQSVIKADLRINYLDTLLFREKNIEDYFARLEKSKVPLVISIGPRATRVALKHLKKTPVLFSMVGFPRTLGPVVGRSCGVTMDVSIERFFRTLRRIRPDARNVFAFYSTDQGEFTAGEGEYFDLRSGFYYKKVRLERKSDLPAALKRIGDGADAFYIVPDPLYDRVRFRQLSDFCRRNKIVLMTGFTSLVKAGATFAITPDYIRIGVLTGNMANRILSGESTCRGEGVVYPDRTSFYLNEKYAKASGLEIPRSIRERARLTRLFNAGVRLYNKNKLKSARIIFDAILKRDPENKIAADYRKRVIGRMTGAQTTRLMREASEHSRNKRYARAMDAYDRALKLNPALTAAKEGRARAVKAKSEAERLAGNRFAARGDHIQAIRRLQAALVTRPGNEAARADLARVRKSQYYRLPGQLKSGIRMYNNREYANSIRVFSNILLINPGHKQAVEYLRLSRKKRAAIERLLRRKRRGT